MSSSRFLSMLRGRALLLAICALPFLMAHGDGGCGGCSSEEDEIFGPPTQTACPEISTLTYGTFGEQFMTQYCTRCHSSQLKGADRNGAPEFHDYDTVGGVRSVADHIDQTAASGPAATNTSMPIGAPQPTDEERRKLAEWIACGAP